LDLTKINERKKLMLHYAPIKTYQFDDFSPILFEIPPEA
jgi:hypothetical protein